MSTETDQPLDGRERDCIVAIYPPDTLEDEPVVVQHE